MQRMRDPLVVGRVVGDVLDPFVRKVQLRVTYTSREVTNGYEFKPSAVANQPTVEIHGTDSSSFFTLVSRTKTWFSSYPCSVNLYIYTVNFAIYVFLIIIYLYA
jgi:hypothetical protein